MRFLGIGETNDLAAMYRRLADAGHEVRVFVEDEACHDVFGGMLDFTSDWQAELGWLRGAGTNGKDGVVIFESACKGAVQDALRKDGFNVIGGSALGDRLESDRAFGQDVLRGIGLRTAPCRSFVRWDDGMRFLASRPGRYVLKFNGAGNPRTRNYVGQLDSGADVLALLQGHARRQGPEAPEGFVLMDHLSGVEVGVGAYFNGTTFMNAVCIDFEHKHFFPHELGELTGEMGTVVSYRGAGRLFAAVLAPLVPVLRDGGYCGYINVNLMANEEGLWPLEFTSRFGYPGYAICETLHGVGWDEVFRRMLSRDTTALPTSPGFAVGVVLTVPPFPYRDGYAALSKGNPVFLDDAMSAQEKAGLSLAEVALDDGTLCTSGASGYIGVATGTGATVQTANNAALALAAKVVTPNLRYRTDIGDRVSRSDWDTLRRLGWRDATAA